MAPKAASTNGSEGFYRTLLEFAPVAIVTFDADAGRVIEANASAERLFGLPRATLLQRGPAELSPERQPDGRPSAVAGRELLERALSEGRLSFEWEFSGADGRDIPCEVRMVRLPTEGRNLLHGQILDLTERKQTEAQLVAAERMASLGMLAAGVAHEINNPLSAAVANLDLAMADLADLGHSLPLTHQLREELGDARDAVERLRHIVRDLRVFSRPEDEPSAPVDVQQVLESTLRMAWNEIRHRARLVKDFGRIPTALASESRVGQVFLNLVLNAAQSIAEGNAEKNEIRVATATDAEGRIVVRIADTGSGIAPEIQRRLFTPFVTTKPPGVGTGLGLSICHRIVTGLGGSISFQSEVGKGTEFRVVLPAASAAPEPTAGGSPSATTYRRGKVLVVDDEVGIVNAVRRLLRQDHDVTGATSAREALATIRTGRTFDVILCDVMMPEMSGMDLFAELQRIRPDQEARMVFLTGGAFTARAQEFLESMPNIRVEKPFDQRELKALVNRLVG